MDYPSTILKFFSFCSNLVLLCSFCSNWVFLCSFVQIWYFCAVFVQIWYFVAVFVQIWYFCAVFVQIWYFCFPFSLIFSPNVQKSLLFNMAFFFFRFKKKWVFPLKLIMPCNLALINSHCKNKHTKLFGIVPLVKKNFHSTYL